MAPRTVRNYLKHVQGFLDKAGPPTRGNRDAVGILPGLVPWVKLPRAAQKIPRIVPWDRVAAVYRVAGILNWSQVPGVEPAAWWQALLVVCLYTGLRRRTLFELELSDVGWQGRRLVIPGERIKSGRPLIVPLHDVAYRHLETIRTDRRLVFQCPVSKRHFYDRLHRLQDKAAFPRLDILGYTICAERWAQRCGKLILPLRNAC